MAVFRYQCTCVVLMMVSYLGNGSFTVVSHRVYLHTGMCVCEWKFLRICIHKLTIITEDMHMSYICIYSCAV